jgi:xanthine dehydrogenase YagS FAD-binding subunit
MMESFEWVDATSVDHAAALLAATRPDGPVVAKAGGIDLIDLMKEGLVRPARIVNLRSINGLDTITFDAERGLSLDALVTLARIESSPEVRRWYPALAEAAAHAATPQVRNAATIGGNLLQRPRCWYLRSQHFHSEGVDAAAALASGEHQYHAIFDNAECALVHASTPATALVAYGAQVHLTGPRGRGRTVPLAEFLRPPRFGEDRDTTIEPDEILTRVTLPPTGSGTRAAYHKQTERDSYDWPICDVGCVLQMKDDIVAAASIVLGWVAPTPRRADTSEQRLVGKPLTDAQARDAAKAAVAGATPLAKNGFKVPILEAVVRRTLLAAAVA